MGNSHDLTNKNEDLYSWFTYIHVDSLYIYRVGLDSITVYPLDPFGAIKGWDINWSEEDIASTTSFRENDINPLECGNRM